MGAERIIGKKFPLEERTILLTQTEYQIKKIEKLLHLEKAIPISIPCIEPKLILSDQEMIKLLAKIEKYDWIIFTSQNAFLLYEEFLKKNNLQQQLHAIKIATVGHETRETIEQAGYQIAFTPQIPKTSKEFFDQWMQEVDLKGKTVLFPRSKRSISQIPENLEQQGTVIVPIEFYDVLPHENVASYYQALASIEVDWLLFSSPTAVNSFFSMRPNDEEIRHWIFSSGVKIATIGSSTSKALAEKNVPISCESPNPSTRWMIETIKAFEKLENWDVGEEE
ncbi:MAG: uroporphyrinogen-III synthase [Deltaproteobacteria bacterium]|nr:uroporphyrinogen-III synthase [Deltaproteobacteria bacterium]